MKYLSVLVFSVVCSAAFCSNETDIQTFSNQTLTSGELFTIAGSNTVGARLTPAWAKLYLEAKGATSVGILTRDTPNEYRVQGLYGAKPVFIDILAHGSSTGFKALQSQQADMAMSSRPIKESEREALTHLGDLLSPKAEHVVAIDGLAIIVNPANPLLALSVENIGKIFSGNIQNWKALGGPDKPIIVFARDENSGTWDTFKSLVLAKRYRLATSAQRFESNDDLSDQVANTPGAIGFVGLASVRLAKALSVYDGQATALLPEPLFVATEDYPLARRLFLYTPEQAANPYVKEFVAFAQDVIGQKEVESVGFVSQNPIRVEVASSKSAPPFYQRLALEGRRLSVNFRFKQGSAELDNKAKQDALRLANYFKQPKNHSLRVQLVGFSHQDRTHQAANVLSKLRATAVKLALYKHGITAEPVAAFGSRMLIADGEAGSAKAKNDRVEVWVLDEADSGDSTSNPHGSLASF